ncbi:MAG: VWA domain-containing protein [Myxococcales bacterium]|nr:VWA domain-containing protein [Myxococcales bacterium]
MSHSPRSPLLCASLCLPLLACFPAPQEGDTTGSPDATTGQPSSTSDTPTVPPPSTTTGDDPPPNPTSGPVGTTGGSSSSDDNGDAPPIIFDNGMIPEAPLIDDECGNVDFLFVIDNSGSMAGEQASLIANFPAFIDGIQTVLEQVDNYQVGIVTTDAYTYNVPGCNQLSSLVVQTGGADSSNMACGPYDEGNNYMTEADDLATSFSCAAQVGTVGSASERPMQAMVETVQRIEGDPGECNEGFIRDDALLVIVVITDEPDTNSLGTPMTWYDDVVAAKLGIPENVVVVSFINTPAGGCSGGVANNMAMFTDMWGDNGFQVPICVPDYAPYFDEAVALIDVACDNYVPPG